MDAREGDRPERLFIWAVWALMLTAALRFVLAFAPAAPVCDDYSDLLGMLSGDEPLSPAALWRQVNEHRVPLPRLVTLALAKLTGGALWAENLLNALVLGAVSAACLVAVRRLRGRTTYADAALPLLLLHLGHAECFAFRLTLNHVGASALSVLALLAMLSAAPLRLTAVLLLLPLCGANGLPVALAGAAWLALQRRWALAAAAAGLVGLYFVGYHSAGGPRGEVDVTAVVRVFARAAMTDVHLLTWPAALIVPALLAATVGLVVVRRGHPGLLLFLGAMATTAVGIAHGRGPLGPGALNASRYAAVLAPLMVGMYLAWVLYGGRLGAAVFVVVICSAAPTQFVRGQAQAARIDRSSRSFRLELEMGEDPAAVGARFEGRLYPVGMGPLVPAAVRQMAALGWRPYAGRGAARDALPAMTVEASHSLTWRDNRGESTGPDPYVVLRLPQARRVKALRVRFSLERPAVLEVFWKRQGANEFGPARSFRQAVPAGERTVVVPVGETIDRVRFDPDEGPCSFALHAVEIAEGT